ncbi:hypothetical protein [Chitiniphilus eburneus]|uniref:Uncharacterized protein n=1 Tax=Chitiniphilus eburneus TaxID=2571148 RepID=A0A4U0QCK3_9NEIS|nr:hypothetical protein [Chitiniphilus eburneus]TJZ79147.1 hypothetical protein FAZ21_02355 [Chitiniphilus eburneus]
MLWNMLKRLKRGPVRVQEENALLAPTELLPATRARQEAKATHPLSQSLLYRIKRDALAIVADMNRGVAMPDCALLARQLAFVQKELIQAAYHDESLPREQRQALARYHALNIRQGIGERRDRPMRGVSPGGD